ncbi:MAG: rhodanese-like domain-containing protein, partial [Planctomycetota bacterium]|nr:rhodanese-like domain-containing protein [Planctomycetota bacterium]
MEGPLDAGQVPMVGLGALENAERLVIVDLRSPAEYADDHLPGAVNVPLLDDDDRAVVGTLYHREGREAAFREGRAVVLRRVAELVGRILEVVPDGHGCRDLTGAAAATGVPSEEELARRVEELTTGGLEALETELVPYPVSRVPEPGLVLHCWRGGLRSRSVAALLLSLGLEGVVVLEGGYRSWRRAVRAGLASWPARDQGSVPPTGTYVLRGLTGVGKTLVLRELEGLRPGWTVDLEGLAGHRSSLLGMVGMVPVSQKNFESALWRCLAARPALPLVLEGESRKVGDVEIPPRPWQALCGAANILLEAPLERRVEVLMEDYLAPA